MKAAIAEGSDCWLGLWMKWEKYSYPALYRRMETVPPNPICKRKLCSL